MRPWMVPVVLALVLGGCIGARTESEAPIDVAAPGIWTTLAPMPTARQEMAVAALDGRVYVIGGFGESAAPLATVEAYDPATNLWEPRAPLPVPTHHAAAVVLGNRLYVVGGYTGGRVRWTASQSLYEYDPLADTWTARTPMPTPRGALAAVALNGRLHAIGGSGAQLTPEHEVYDPTGDKWSVVNALPTARDHLAAVVFDGRIWVVGGRESFLGTQYANVEIYDPQADAWRTGQPLPAGRGGLAAVALPRGVLVFGGEAPLKIFSATEMFEAATNRWIAKAPMPTPRHGIGAAIVGSRVYVPGGGTEPGLAVSAVNEAYVP